MDYDVVDVGGHGRDASRTDARAAVELDAEQCDPGRVELGATEPLRMGDVEGDVHPLTSRHCGKRLGSRVYPVPIVVLAKEVEVRELLTASGEEYIH